MSNGEDDLYRPKYHETGAAYILPFDQYEQGRLVAQHNAWKALMHDKIVHAPVSEPKLIVDVGCGPGPVTKELGASFPAARVIGLDLVSIPEAHSEHPANVEFVQGDIKDVLKRASSPLSLSDENLSFDKVDYVFERALICGMTEWPQYVQMLADAVKPGCWIEMHEWDMQVVLKDGTDVTDEWPWQREMIVKARETQGLDLRPTQGLAKWMRDAGLVDIHTVDYRATIGSWDVARNPQTEVMASYLHCWWPHITRLMISQNMKNAVSADVIQAHQVQMAKDFDKAEREEKKAYGIRVCYGRKG